MEHVMPHHAVLVGGGEQSKTHLVVTEGLRSRRHIAVARIGTQIVSAVKATVWAKGLH